MQQLNKHYELLRKLAQQARQYPNLIVQTRHGYRLFNRYDIFAHEDSILCVDHRSKVTRFTSIANAVAWISFDRYNRIIEAQNLLRLDQQRGRAKRSIELLQAKIQANPTKELYYAKLSAAQNSCESAEKQLTECRSQAKYYQNKGFIR